MKAAAIFRKRLLSLSETFIADQGQFLPQIKPVYVGYSTDHSGIAMIESSKRILLDEYSRMPLLDKQLLRWKLHCNRRWLGAIRAQQVGIIHAHFFNDGLDAMILGEKLGLPVITTLHGHDITKHANARADNPVHRRFFESVDRIIAVSDFIAEQALSRGCPESKLTQHYIGIDLDKFSQPKQESAEPSLLFVGRLVEKKGCTYLLQAMQQLRQRYPELTLTVVGDGDQKQALQQEARERELKVDFVGSEPATRIRERMASSWLFVAPSITAADGDAEGLGMVFLEAQAMMTPVVSFRSGGVVEAVAEGQTGLLCDEKDVATLADNMASLLENQALRRHMGEQGRTRVETRFDVRKQCAQLEKIYAKLA